METSRFQAVARSLFDEGSVVAPIFRGQDLIPSLHRGLAAGGGACASVQSCGAHQTVWIAARVIGVVEFCEADFDFTNWHSPMGTSSRADFWGDGYLPMKSHQPIGLKGGVLAALPACRTTSDSRRQSHGVPPFPCSVV